MINERPVEEELTVVKPQTASAFQPVMTSSPLLSRHVAHSVSMTATSSRTADVQSTGNSSTSLTVGKVPDVTVGDNAEDDVVADPEPKPMSPGNDLQLPTREEEETSKEPSRRVSVGHEEVTVVVNDDSFSQDVLEPSQNVLSSLPANALSLSHELAETGDSSLMELDPGSDLTLINPQTDELMEQVHTLETELNGLRLSSAGNAEQLTNLKEEREDLKERVDDLEAQRNETQKKVRQLEDDLRQKQQELEEAQVLLKQNEVRIFILFKQWALIDW